MKELAELPAATFDTKFKPFLVTPDTNLGICIHLALHAVADKGSIFCNGFFNVNTNAPVEVGCAIPLPRLGLFIQLAKVRAG